jgi:rRNA maturation protein Nop10
MSGFPGPLISEPGTYIYVGPAPYIDSFGAALVPGRCYYVETPIALASVVLTFANMPPSTQGGLAGDLLYISSNVGDGNNSTCENAVQCPPCDSYTFCDECPPDTVDITYTLVDGECVANNGHVTWSFPVNSCLCFVLIPCDGVTPPFVSSTTGLDNYLNEFVYVSFGDWSGCVYVSDLNVSSLITTNCEGSIDVVIDGDVECDCESVCYYIEGADGISYVQYVDNSDQLLQIVPSSTAPWLTLCSKVYPIVGNTSDNYTILELGSCTDNSCPQKCFKLIDCLDDTNILYSNSYSLLPYAINTEVVKIAGHTECWTVELTQDECDCATDVIVVTSSVDCEACKTLIAYKLTSCDNPFTVQYTYDDLSDFVGQTVLTDCGCFIVELINYAPPSVQTIVILTAFDNCADCKRPYYKLSDCNTENEIYTFSDLSDHVGSVVKIANCDECWTVTETDIPINPGIVTVISSHIDCITCVTTAPCICSNVRNDNAIAYTYDYIDCYGDTQSVTVQPGETSPKICLIKWLEPEGCNCLVQTTTVGSSVTSVIKVASGSLINHKQSWYNNTTLYIYYNGTQWIMNDTQGNPQYYLAPSKSDCPAGIWRPFSSIPEVTPTVISTVSCQSFYQFFGDCNNGVCPAPIYPKRGIKPGYNTPACSAEKYEEISCKSAQILYREVLTLRYGISNCCPENDEYWLIKKELIDLAALYNPDFPCSPSGCGCGNNSGCDCGCGQSCGCSCSGPRTCNS